MDIIGLGGGLLALLLVLLLIAWRWWRGQRQKRDKAALTPGNDPTVLPGVAELWLLIEQAEFPAAIAASLKQMIEGHNRIERDDPTLTTLAALTKLIVTALPLAQEAKSLERHLKRHDLVQLKRTARDFERPVLEDLLQMQSRYAVLQQLLQSSANVFEHNQPDPEVLEQMQRHLEQGQ
jgi:hypothetical protein